MFSFIFPGQGSQSLKMGQFLYEPFAEARKTFQEANDILGFNLARLMWEGPEEELNITKLTQPAILTVSVALQRVIEAQFGIKASIVAGHSVGEYAALVAAGVLKFEEALPLVYFRGKVMQEAVPLGQGGMVAALTNQNEELLQLCKQVHQTTGLVIEPANFNAPGQLVLSGHLKAIEELEKLVPTAGVKAKLIRLNVSAPFHCSLMKPAEEKMREKISEISFKSPAVPVIQNISAREETSHETIKSQLISQISGSVRWESSMKRAIELGYKKFVECGSGKVLSGLMKKIDSQNAQVFNVNSLEELNNLAKI